MIGRAGGRRLVALLVVGNAVLAGSLVAYATRGSHEAPDPAAVTVTTAESRQPVPASQAETPVTNLVAPGSSAPSSVSVSAPPASAPPTTSAAPHANAAVAPTTTTPTTTTTTATTLPPTTVGGEAPPGG